MKKRWLAILVTVVIAAFALAACGGGNSGGNTPAGSGNAGGSTGGGSSSAETFDVGAFTVAVPSGWKAFPQSDVFGEQDADGNYPIDPEQIMIAKGVSDELSALSAPLVRVYYHSPETTIMDARDFYDNVADITGVKINGTDCEAYSGESFGYVYQFITYPTDKATYEIQVLTSVEGKDTGINWEDADVQTILNSIAAK